MALTRRALIITNPGELEAENYCEGVNKDAKLYKSFMLSGVGGAWRADEINMLKRPSQKEVLEAVNGMKRADYSVVAFCGHGYHSAAEDSTILELKAGVELDSMDLRQGATKRTIILDCCREVHKPMALDEALKKALAKAERVVDPTKARSYFDKDISECTKGLAVLYGCSISERAGDDAQRGGFYSYSLLSGADAWARDNKTDTTQYYDALSVISAHDRASVRVKRLSGGTQTPTIQKPMSGPYFPLAVFV
jgi:hypothetical protein